MDLPEIRPHSHEQFTPAISAIAEARGDLRIMACTRAAYEAYAVQVARERNKEPITWQALLERPAELRPWIAATLAAMTAMRAGNSGVYESAAAGTGRQRLGQSTEL